MNLIPHVKGAEEAFSIGCLHELRGTIGSIADELAAEILCDWALDPIRGSKVGSGTKSTDGCRSTVIFTKGSNENTLA